MVEDEGENFGAAIERNWGGEGNPSVRCGCGAACENLRYAISLSQSLRHPQTKDHEIQ